MTTCRKNYSTFTNVTKRVRIKWQKRGTKLHYEHFFEYILSLIIVHFCRSKILKAVVIRHLKCGIATFTSVKDRSRYSNIDCSCFGRSSRNPCGVRYYFWASVLGWWPEVREVRESRGTGTTLRGPARWLGSTPIMINEAPALMFPPTPETAPGHVSLSDHNLGQGPLLRPGITGCTTQR